MLSNIDLFSDFSLWNKIHYYSIVHRNKYPNLFFFYFSYSGKIQEEFSKKEKTCVIELIKQFKQKINGSWGFLSLFTENKNGFEIYKFFSKTEYMTTNVSQMIIQDVLPFSEEIKDKLEITFKKFESLYEEKLNKFEEYLSKNDEKRYEYKEFSNSHKILFFHTKISLLKQIKEEKYDFSIKNQNKSEIRRNKNKIIEDMDEDTINESKKKEKNFQLNSFKEEDYDDSFITESSEIETMDTISINILDEIPKIQICRRFNNGYFSDYRYNLYTNKKEKIKYSSDKEKASYSEKKDKILFSKFRYDKFISNYTHKYKIFDQVKAKKIVQTLNKKSLIRDETKKSSKKIKKKLKLKEKKFEEDNYFNESEYSISEFSNISNRNILDDERSLLSLNIRAESKNNLRLDNVMKRNPLKTLFDNSQFFSLNSKMKNNLSTKEVKSLYANDKNYSITNYFPKIKEVNSQLEREVIKTLSKLINNDMYQELLLFMKKNDLNFQVFTHINTYHNSLLNKGNSIDINLIESIKLSNSSYNISEQVFTIELESTNIIDNFRRLITLYKNNLNQYIGFYQTLCFSKKAEFQNSLSNLTKCENLLKIFLKNVNDHFQANTIKINLIKDTFTDYMEIFSLFSNVILFHTNYIDNYYDEIILRFENLFSILKALWIKSHEKLNKSFKVFIQFLFYQIMIKLFHIDFKPLLREFSRCLKPEYTAFVSLYYRLIDIYLFITSGNQTEVDMIEKSFDLLNIMFVEYMYPFIKSKSSLKSFSDEENSIEKLNIEFQSLLNDLYKNNYLDKVTIDKSLKSHLYQLFIINITKCYNHNELSSDTQRLFMEISFLQLFHRYLNLLNLVLIDNKKKAQKFDFLVNFYSNTHNIESYYDFETKIFNISNLSTKSTFSQELKKKKLFYHYVNSDINFLFEILQHWKVDSNLVIKIMLYILSSFTAEKRKFTDISDLIKKKDLYKLLNFVYLGQEIEDEMVLLFISSFVNTLSQLILPFSDENSEKRFISKFVTQLGFFKAIFDSHFLAETSIKLGLIPTLCIVLSSLKFINILQYKSSREHCVKVIVEKLNFEKSTPSLKGFTISIFLKLIQHFDQQNNNEDIKKYVTNYLNPYVKEVISVIKAMETKKLNDNEQTTLTELYETLHYYLKSLVNISEDSSNLLLIKNQSILDELKEVLSTKNVFPFIYRKMVVTLLNNLFEKIHRNSENIIQNVINIDEDDENNMQIDIREDLTDEERIFLEKNELVAKNVLVQIINSYITDKRNIQHYKGRVTIDLANYCCETSAKMLGILHKNNIGNRYSFIEVYGTDKTFFSSIIRNTLITNKNYNILSEITSLAFKAYSIFLKYNSDCFTNFVLNREYINYHQFLVMFFFALFHTNSVEKDDYLSIFMDYIIPCKVLLEELVTRTSFRDMYESLRVELSYYNILLLIISYKETIDLSRNNLCFLKKFIENILDSLIFLRRSQADIIKIEAKHFFTIIRNLEEIIVRNLYQQDGDYHNIVESIMFQIINKFSNQFLNDQLDNDTSTFLKNALKLICDNNKPYNNCQFNDYDQDFLTFVEEIFKQKKIDEYKEIVFKLIDKITLNLELNFKNFLKDFKFKSNFHLKIKNYLGENIDRSSIFFIEIFKYITYEYIHYSNKLNCELYLYFTYNILYFYSKFLKGKDLTFYINMVLDLIKLDKVSNITEVFLLNKILKYAKLCDHFNKEVIDKLGIMIVYSMFLIIYVFCNICKRLKIDIEGKIEKIKRKLKIFIENDLNIQTLYQYEENHILLFDERILIKEMENVIFFYIFLRGSMNDSLNEIFKTSDILLHIICNKYEEQFSNNFANIKRYLNEKRSENEARNIIFKDI